MRIEFRRVSTRIAVYAVVLLAVTCLAFAYFAYTQGTKAVLEEVDKALTAYADEAARHLESKLQAQFDVLEAIAARPEMTGMNWDMQRPVLLAEIERLKTFEYFGSADQTGRIRFTNGTTLDFSGRPFVEKALAGEVAVSDLVVSPLDGELSLYFAVPINRLGAVVGVLVGQLDQEFLSAAVRDLQFADEGWAYIVSGAGTIMAHPVQEMVLKRSSIYDKTGDFAPAGAAIQTLGLRQRGTASYQTNDGARRVDALVPVGLTDWTLAVSALESEMLSNVYRLRTVMLTVSVVFIALGIGASLILGRGVSRPLEEVRAAVEDIATGDLSVQVAVKSKDEVGFTISALNAAVERIAGVLQEVAESAQTLARMSQEMAAASQEVSASTEEVASTTNQFSATLEAVNARAIGVRQRAEEISDRAAAGEGALREILNQLTVVRDNSQSLSDNISHLGQISQEIGIIVSTITGIADQTNLLALNAAIEAARAGEQGRGFAVVAEEVRQLAEESSQAAVEITDLIQEIQSGIAKAVAGMNEGAEEAEQALGQVTSSSQILREILASVRTIVEDVQHISKGLEELNLGGADIASVTQEQAASTSEVSHAAQGLTEMAALLQDLVGRFRLPKDL